MQVNKDTFCVLPFVHAVMNPYDSIKHKASTIPCCRFAHSGTEYFEDKDPINKSPTWIKLQEQFLTNQKPKECSHCWRDEAHDIVSYRQHNLNYFHNVIKDGKFLEKKLLYLELMFGNTCNLTCRSCSSTYSSKWVSVDNYMVSNNAYLGNQTPNIEFSNWKELDLSNLTHLKIMGGEPFYQKGALDLLDHLSNIGVLKNIHLSIPTNCTMQLTDRWKELLIEAKQVDLYISVDAYGNLNNYIREGSDWDALEKNMHSFRKFFIKHYDKSRVSINTVVSVYNVNKLIELETYIKQYFSWSHYMDIAYYPSYLDVALLPDSIKNNIINSGVPEKVGSYLKSKNYSEKDFEMLKKTTTLLDKYHEKSFKDYNPEMYDWIINA